jgi:hypothetical protein
MKKKVCTLKINLKEAKNLLELNPIEKVYPIVKCKKIYNLLKF